MNKSSDIMEREAELIKNIGKVKRVRRAGWVREGIDSAESVADHSFRVAVMAMIFGDKLGLDTDKLIRMALMHDISEGSLGDKVVERGNQIDYQARQQKDRKEIETLRQIFAGAQDLDEIINLQANEQSEEAKILKQLERLEMAAQALEYEEEYGKDLTEFFDNASHHITHPYLVNILNAIKSHRRS